MLFPFCGQWISAFVEMIIGDKEVSS